MNPALFVSLSTVRQDPALTTRGDRKILVTELYPGSEGVATAVHWRAPGASGICPVLLTRDTELALFNQTAKQTRHCHQRGTEIYDLLQGTMTIEVEGIDYTLRPGDMIIVNPGAFHQIRRQGEFLCRVITVNCGGISDRFEG
jgi:mannose-6-phosphate isomerase-like protein (cupin superfamily)